jgi:hypothetical protein
MPSPFYEPSKRFGLRRLLGTSNGKDIGTGFQSLGADIDNINHGHQDFLQAGVVESADWTFTANIVSGTGELGSTGTTGGKAWLPDPVLSGALMRTVTALAKLEKLKPGSLPSSGKYMSVAFEIAPAAEDGWDNAVTVTAHSGVEKSTEAEAIAAPPATTAGKIKICDVVIRNAAGVYSIGAQRDRRPWAKGAWARVKPSGLTKSTSFTEISSTAVRMELSGKGLWSFAYSIPFTVASGSALVTLGIKLVRPNGSISEFTIGFMTVSSAIPQVLSGRSMSAPGEAGSYLVSAVWKVSEGEVTIGGGSLTPELIYSELPEETHN